MPTPAQARAYVAGLLEAAAVVRVVDHYRYLDQLADPAALVDWLEWAEPVTGCRDGPVRLEVLVCAPQMTDPAEQARAIDQLVEVLAPAVDDGQARRGPVTKQSEDPLGWVARIPVEVR